MAEGDVILRLLPEAASNVGKAFGALAGRRQNKSLISYLLEVGKMYLRYGYLPMVDPSLARNFTFYRVLGQESPAGKALERLVDFAAEAIGLEVDKDSPVDQAASLMFWLMAGCIYDRVGHYSLASFNTRVGTLEIPLKSLCSTFNFGGIIYLSWAGHHYIYYSPEFVIETLKSFLGKTKSGACEKCREKSIHYSRDNPVRVLREFEEECADCYEAFRRELTSRVTTGLRAASTSLLLHKWVFEPRVVYGELVDTGYGRGGCRTSYPIVSTYLGRLVSEVNETWSKYWVGGRTVIGLGKLLFEYYRIFPRVRSYISRWLSKAEPGDWADIHNIEPVIEWVEYVKRLEEEEPRLAEIGAMRKGELVVDLVNYIITERVHYYSAMFEKPSIAEAFTTFDGLDLGSLLFERLLRPKGLRR